MLTCIIKEKTNQDSYYINIEEKGNNTSTISVVHINQDKIEELSTEDIKNLVRNLLSSKLTYKEKYNDYDVYLDEANNKRYFKNGLENYFMFIENNGVSAVSYFDKIDKNKNPSAKRINVIVGTLIYTIIIDMAILIPFSGDIQKAETDRETISYIIDLSDEEMVNIINASFHLSKDEKEYICNNTYFNFLLDYTSRTRNYELRNRLNNINVRYYESEEWPNTSGYYSPTRGNTINILEEFNPDENPLYKDYCKDTFIHEFIHLTQSNSKYSYIIEASDEILKNEFYNIPVTTYGDLVVRTKVLMEIIGPEPIEDCNYNDYPTLFEESIKKYLSEEEANELLEIFSTSSHDITDPEKEEERDDKNNRVDSLLAKMYYNKTGKDIEEDMMINLIYSGYSDNRLYFNTNSIKYNDSFHLNWDYENIDRLNIEDVINSDNVNYYEYSVESIQEINGIKNHIYIQEKTLDFSSIPTTSRVLIEFKDGTRGYVDYNKDKNEWNTVLHYRSVENYEPSIPEKFPDQVNRPINNKEIPEKIESEAKLL